MALELAHRIVLRGNPPVVTCIPCKVTVRRRWWQSWDAWQARLEAFWQTHLVREEA